MRSALVCLLTLILSSIADADPGITLPAALNLEPGRLAKIEATTAGKTVRWVNPDPVNLDLIASESGRWVIIAAPKPGIYRVAAYTAITDAEGKLIELPEAAVCVITVAGPKPPEPPVPPVPPQPADPLAKELRVFYDADQAPAELKRQTVRQLALLYRAAAILCSDRKYVKVGQLNDAIRSKAPEMGETLMPLRRRVSVDMVSLFGKDPEADLTANHRGAGEAFFSRLAGILEAMP